MQLATLDVVIVVLYIIAVFLIAMDAGFFMKRTMLVRRREGMSAMEGHYLAGRSITFWELLLSILATEFSALAFLSVPTYVYFGNLSYLRFVLGACVSRALIALLFLPRLYGRGLTIFEILGRSGGASARSGRRTFALFYLFTKFIGVSLRLLGGATLIAAFFNISMFIAIVLIAILTYLYIMLGGLKAVVRTDMIQAGIFILGGIGAHFAVVDMGDASWLELMSVGFEGGKFQLLDGNGLTSFIYGFIAGIVYDAATHGVDQDIAQKLLGAKDQETARKALAWSVVGSLCVNGLFLTLGVLLWAYYTSNGQPLPAPDDIFSSLLAHSFPTPFKGLMAASILAACMSTLDSAINGLSACFWNDIMSAAKASMFRVYIHLDNFIITVSIIIVTYLFAQNPGLVPHALHAADLCTIPLLAFFVGRMMLQRFVPITFTPIVIVMSVLSCFLGMALNHFRFGFDPQLTIIYGLLGTGAFMWFYARINSLFARSETQV